LTENKNKCITLALTNKACRIINGQTIHKFLACAFSNKSALINKLKGIDYIIVDEVSMMKEIFYKIFIDIKNSYPKMKFILIGDFGQLKPVNDRVKSCNYENSPALFELCSGNKLTLTFCRRADDELFNLLKPENIKNLSSKDFGNTYTQRHICFTNEKRKAINQHMMKFVIDKKTKECRDKKRKQPLKIDLKKLDYDNNSQDVTIMEGMPVIARINSLGDNIANNETFDIIQLSESVCVLSGGITIDIKDFQRLFYVAYAITCHKSQGQTFDHAYTIHEFSRFEDDMKYVALSRATKKEFINVFN
jgi:ATP-dependent exoDNAse (exonuclease V) alpha subunit